LDWSHIVAGAREPEPKRRAFESRYRIGIHT
jgi:hypothetical protein